MPKKEVPAADAVFICRALQRTLHLIVKKEGGWVFPSSEVKNLEELTQVRSALFHYVATTSRICLTTVISFVCRTMQTAEKVLTENFDGKLFSEKITNKTRLRFFRPSQLPAGIFLPSNDQEAQKYGKVRPPKKEKPFV